MIRAFSGTYYVCAVGVFIAICLFIEYSSILVQVFRVHQLSNQHNIWSLNHQYRFFKLKCVSYEVGSVSLVDVVANVIDIATTVEETGFTFAVERFIIISAVSVNGPLAHSTFVIIGAPITITMPSNVTHTAETSIIVSSFSIFTASVSANDTLIDITANLFGLSGTFDSVIASLTGTRVGTNQISSFGIQVTNIFRFTFIKLLAVVTILILVVEAS